MSDVERAPAGNVPTPEGERTATMKQPPIVLGVLAVLAAQPARSLLPDGRCPECGGTGTAPAEHTGEPIPGRVSCPRGCPQIADEPEAGR